MNNTNVGGNGGNFAGEQGAFDATESFEKAFQVGKQSETNKGLGEAATVGMMEEIFGGEEVGRGEDYKLPDAPEMMPAPEIKPLIADGTTEKKLVKIGVSLVSEKVDTEGINAEVKRIKNLPLYEQSPARDRASAEMIYANFGRMVGNDDIGEIQAEEQRRTA